MRCFAAKPRRPIRRQSAPRRKCWHQPSGAARPIPSRWHWKSRQPPWLLRAAMRRTSRACSHRRTATSASTTTCAAPWRASQRCCRRSSSITPCTTRLSATGPSAPAAWPQATRLTAYESTFASGLLEAAAQCAADQRAVLLAGYDMPAVGALASVTTSRDMLAVALVISPSRTRAHGRVLRMVAGSRRSPTSALAHPTPRAH